MEEKKYTIQEVLEITIRNLGSIQVPVGLMQTIGVPITQCIGNLRECVITLAKNGQENKNGGEHRDGKSDDGKRADD